MGNKFQYCTRIYFFRAFRTRGTPGRYLYGLSPVWRAVIGGMEWNTARLCHNLLQNGVNYLFVSVCFYHFPFLIPMWTSHGPDCYILIFFNGLLWSDCSWLFVCIACQTRWHLSSLIALIISCDWQLFSSFSHQLFRSPAIMIIICNNIYFDAPPSPACHKSCLFMENEICSGALNVRQAVWIFLYLFRWNDWNAWPRGLNSFPSDDIDIGCNLQYFCALTCWKIELLMRD